MVNSAVLGLLQVQQKYAFCKQNRRRQKCRNHYFNSSCFLLNCQISTQNSFNVHHAALTSLPSSQGTFCPQRTGVNTTEMQAEGSSGRGPPSATGTQGQYHQAPARAPPSSPRCPPPRKQEPAHHFLQQHVAIFGQLDVSSPRHQPAGDMRRVISTHPSLPGPATRVRP